MGPYNFMGPAVYFFPPTIYKEGRRSKSVHAVAYAYYYKGVRGSNVSVRPPSHSINNSLSNQSRAINIHSFAHTIATGRLVMISTSYISFVQLDARPITYLPRPFP